MKKNFEESLGDLFGETEMSSFEESWVRPYLQNKEDPIWKMGVESSNDNSPKPKKGNENG